MSSQLENRPIDTVPPVRNPDYASLRQPDRRATLPLLEGKTTVDLATLERVAAALRAQPGGRRRARPGTSADIERLRRDMGDTVADLWAAPPDEARGAC
ncbi:MAG: hypothetical protein ACRD0P_38800 [Stackebrandtia sp.]